MTNEKIQYRTKKGKILNWLCRYSVFQDGKQVVGGIIGWQEAIKIAGKYTQNLFNNVRKVEILNIWTGEIISLQEAEKKVANTLKGASHSGT